MTGQLAQMALATMTPMPSVGKKTSAGEFAQVLCFIQVVFMLLPPFIFRGWVTFSALFVQNGI
mgnify:CR=1 FL=1